jgi:hypothetical protein
MLLFVNEAQGSYLPLTEISLPEFEICALVGSCNYWGLFLKLKQRITVTPIAPESPKSTMIPYGVTQNPRTNFGPGHMIFRSLAQTRGLRVANPKTAPNKLTL